MTEMELPERFYLLVDPKMFEVYKIPFLPVFACALEQSVLAAGVRSIRAQHRHGGVLLSADPGRHRQSRVQL